MNEDQFSTNSKAQWKDYVALRRTELTLAEGYIDTAHPCTHRSASATKPKWESDSEPISYTDGRAHYIDQRECISNVAYVIHA